MAKHTIKERLERGLAALGWTKEAASGYRIAGWRHAEHKTKIFVGENGSFRAGESKSKSHSLNFGHMRGLYGKVLAAGDAALAATPSARRNAALDEFTEAT